MPTFTLRGGKFRTMDEKEVMLRMQRGDSVTLIREPENPHDPNAIRVMSGDAHIGYVPREQTEEIHPLFNGDDEALEAYVHMTAGLQPVIGTEPPVDEDEIEEEESFDYDEDDGSEE